MKINWFVSVKYFCTGESVKREITDSISENSTDSDLESWEIHLNQFNNFFLPKNLSTDQNLTYKLIIILWINITHDKELCVTQNHISLVLETAPDRFARLYKYQSWKFSVSSNSLPFYRFTSFDVQHTACLPSLA